MKLNGIWLTHVKLAGGQELVLRKNNFYGWLGGWVCVSVGGGGLMVADKLMRVLIAQDTHKGSC